MLYKFAGKNPVNFDRKGWRQITGQTRSSTGAAPAYNAAYNKARNADIQSGLSAFDAAKKKRGISWINRLPSGPPPTGATAGAQSGVPNKPVDPNQLAWNVSNGKRSPSKPKN